LEALSAARQDVAKGNERNNSSAPRRDQSKAVVVSRVNNTKQKKNERRYKPQQRNKNPFLDDEADASGDDDDEDDGFIVDSSEEEDEEVEEDEGEERESGASDMDDFIDDGTPSHEPDDMRSIYRRSLLSQTTATSPLKGFRTPQKSHPNRYKMNFAMRAISPPKTPSESQYSSSSSAPSSISPASASASVSTSSNLSPVLAIATPEAEPLPISRKLFPHEGAVDEVSPQCTFYYRIDLLTTLLRPLVLVFQASTTTTSRCWTRLPTNTSQLRQTL